MAQSSSVSVRDLDMYLSNAIAVAMHVGKLVRMVFPTLGKDQKRGGRNEQVSYCKLDNLCSLLLADRPLDPKLLARSLQMPFSPPVSTFSPTQTPSIPTTPSSMDYAFSSSGSSTNLSASISFGSEQAVSQIDMDDADLDFALRYLKDMPVESVDVNAWQSFM